MERYLGLSVGTKHVAWAVTNPHYIIQKAKGQDLWGAYSFKEAQTSKATRVSRISRRLLRRGQARLAYVRGVFHDPVDKVDPGFFSRLDDSRFLVEDKTVHQPFSLFADSDYTDRDYYAQYPTIFHLIKELMDSSEPHDVRLVCLAVINIFKHRGHFLNGNLSDEGIGDLKEMYDMLVETAIDCPFPKLDTTSELEEILCSTELTNRDKAKKVCDILNVPTKGIPGETVKLMCGLSGTLSKAFPEGSYDDETEKFSISFEDSEAKFEENLSVAEGLLCDDDYDLLLLLKDIHDWSILATILPPDGPKYLAHARVKSYEKHKHDLAVLKKVYKQYAPEQYDGMFRIMEDFNYSAYAGSVNSKYGKVRHSGKGNRDEFYKKLNAAVSKMPKDDDTEYILKEIEHGTFLPKQLTNQNRVIPMQLHRTELKMILSNAENYLPFLKEKDESGLTASERLIQLFEFKIPYYIGPLLNTETNNGWVVRKESGKIYPWNLAQKVDIKKTSEEFIIRMVKKCTYLNNETVLPKNSLLYQKYMVLNELNNIKVDGSNLSVAEKQDIYNELFVPGQNVTIKKLIKHLKKHGVVSDDHEPIITGIDKNFKSTLSSQKKYRDVLGVKVLTAEQEKMVEQLIYWSTIYKDSVGFLKEKIAENYGDVLSEAQINKVVGIRCKDWGKFSREFLMIEGADTLTGEIKPLIERMWCTNLNLMQLMTDSFTYAEAVSERSDSLDKSLSELEYEDLDGLYLPAPVKRMIWSTISLVKELDGIIKEPPKKIFIDVSDSIKPVEKSKLKRLERLYKGCKDAPKVVEELKTMTDDKLRSKKMYLYFLQKGKCMYTGEELDINKLDDNDYCDIDHIYPRHFVKDDNLETNCVLVKRQSDISKSDTFPIDSAVQAAMSKTWAGLAEKGFMTSEKYNRLTRTEPFSDEELASFIGKQLQDTRYGSKVIGHLLESAFPDSRICFVKSSNVDSFRHQFGFLKCTSINNLHLANDAYLNIVVGNVYDVKFTQNPLNFIKDYRKSPKKYQYHMHKLFDYDVKRNDVTAWSVDNDTSINTVKKMMAKTSPIMTEQTYVTRGAISNATIYSAKTVQKANGVGYLPVKTNDSRLCDATKYGGYTKITGAYFFLVEFTLKDERVRKLEAMPLYLKTKLSSKEALEQYCADVLGYKDPSVRLSRINNNSLIKVDGYYMRLTGRSGSMLVVNDAVQIFVPQELSDYIRLISKKIRFKYTEDALSKEIAQAEKNVKDKKEGDDKDYWKQVVTKEKNLKLYEYFMNKCQSQLLINRPNSIKDKLIGRKPMFCELRLVDQIYVLDQLVSLFSGTKAVADLKLIGEAANAGKAQVSSSISKYSEFLLIKQSLTGLYEYTIDLLTV